MAVRDKDLDDAMMVRLLTLEESYERVRSALMEGVDVMGGRLKPTREITNARVVDMTRVIK